MAAPASPDLLGDAMKVMLPVSLLLVAGIFYAVYRVVSWMDRKGLLPGQAEEREARRRADAEGRPGGAGRPDAAAGPAGAARSDAGAGRAGAGRSDPAAPGGGAAGGARRGDGDERAGEAARAGEPAGRGTEEPRR